MSTFNWPMAIVCAVCGYLLGNFQTAIILSRSRFNKDIRNYGSGNAGSTNMLRVFGLDSGLLTFAGDFLKALVAVLLGRAFMGTYGGYIAGGFVILGHCYPALAGFKGGKGVACSLAVAWLVFPLGGLLATITAMVLLFTLKRVSLCSLAGTLVFSLSVFILRSYDVPLVVLTVFILFHCVLRHWENIGRLIRGEEKPIELKLNKSKK